MATFYIDPNGDDTDDGSIGSPWKNLIYAVLNSGTTDTLIVNEGTNVQTLGCDNVSIDGRTIISENNNPKLTILDFGNVIFKLFSSNTQGSMSGITFLKLTTNSTNQSNFKNFNALYVNNCIFKDCISANVSAFVSSNTGLFNDSNTTLNNCVIDTLSFYDSGKIGAIIGIHISGFVTNLNNCTIYLTDVLRDSSIMIKTLFTAQEDGVINVKNCIIKLKDGLTLSDGYSETRNTAVVNTTYSCLRNVSYTGSETGTITTDPQFVDTDNGFFELKPSSPCVGTGAIT